MSVKLRILPRRRTVFSLQKLQLSLDNLKFLNINPGSYVSISNSNLKCICKVFKNNEINCNYCYIDDSVQFGKTDSTIVTSVINLSDISLLTSPVNFKEINLDIVFETIEDSIKWRKNMSQLNDFIRKYILRLYVFSYNSSIILDNPTQRLGICKIIINVGNTSNEEFVIGRVINSTKITINKIICKLQYDQLQENFNSIKLGGLQNEIQQITNIIDFNKFKSKIKYMGIRPCRQILLNGPPGTGKTSLVRKIAAKTKSTLLCIRGSELSRQNPGETEQELRILFRNAELLTDDGNDTCILLLDELDSICAKTVSNSGSHLARITTQLLLLLDKADKTSGLVIIGTTSKPENLHQGLRRPGRLEKEIFIKVPNEVDRQEILSIIMEPLCSDRMKYDEVQCLCNKLSKLTPGYTGADLTLICQNVALNIYRENKYPSTYIEWYNLFRNCIQVSHPSSLRANNSTIETSRLTLNDIGGSYYLKKSLRTAIEWPIKHPEVFDRMGLPQPKGILLYGPPGCAKTTLACAIAKETHCNFLSISAAELYSPYVGVAEKTISELFYQARQSAPSIIFIDEIDSLVGSRGDGKGGNNDVQERILSTLLTEMDGVGQKIGQGISTSRKLLENEKNAKSENPDIVRNTTKVSNTGVIIIAATNRPDKLDSALVRPGRFDRLIYVPPPDEESRIDILKLLTCKMPVDSNVNLENIAKNTSLFSGADLKNLCKEAALEALSTDGMAVSVVSDKHFQVVLKKIKSSLTQAQIEWYEQFKKNSVMSL